MSKSGNCQKVQCSVFKLTEVRRPFHCVSRVPSTSSLPVVTQKLPCFPFPTSFVAPPTSCHWDSKECSKTSWFMVCCFVSNTQCIFCEVTFPRMPLNCKDWSVFFKNVPASQYMLKHRWYGLPFDSKFPYDCFEGGSVWETCVKSIEEKYSFIS